MQERALHAGRRPSCALRVTGYDASQASFPVACLHRPAGVIRSRINSARMISCIILLRPFPSLTRVTPAQNLRFRRPRWALPSMQTTVSRSMSRSTLTALKARWNIRWFSRESVKITRNQRFRGHSRDSLDAVIRTPGFRSCMNSTEEYKGSRLQEVEVFCRPLRHCAQ